MKGLAICALVVLAMAHLMVEPAQAMTCGDVALCLGQCMTYLTGSDPKPLPACCDGVKQLRDMADTTVDKRFACNCIKQVASRFHNLKDNAVSALPSECGVTLPYPISANFPCNSIP
ncbi:non-specific lipid-transfer protein B-like [Magnolia sinica]|uniref:non-specific lipid-transfer protein B-like n=1 Tax=Magnolia sinica TaxID=86752 RepID=UPI00265803CE|nr:non-specific lipid-transfer protein B-like [Magnolia sinica]